LQPQTTPGNNPLKENNIIQVESNCISNSTGENCCWRKLSLQQHSACNYAGEQPHHKIWRKKIQPNQEYEPNVLPVGDHATLGRALRYSWVSFQHCEYSLCLKQQFFEKLIWLKTMIFYQLKHAKHLLNWNK
jgi:hypothetical protein